MRITISPHAEEVKDMVIEKSGASLLIDMPKKVSAKDIVKILKILISHIHNN